VAQDFDAVSVVYYPDPRLRKRCQPVRRFDENLTRLADRMLELMRDDKGIGLAAPQVGALLRMFVMNHTGEEKDNLVFVNPVIRDRQGSKEGEEGCLSLPDIRVQVRRAARCRITGQDLKGNPIEMEGEDLICRVWQHETDHLDGILIIDRMGPSDQIATRKALKDLEAAYESRRRKAKVG
jgi:peptide deformylase